MICTVHNILKFYRATACTPAPLPPTPIWPPSGPHPVRSAGSLHCDSPTHDADTQATLVTRYSDGLLAGRSQREKPG